MNTSVLSSFAENGTCRRLWFSFLVLWVALLTVQTLRIAAVTPPSFDGSMNLEVARSLSQGEGYRRLYADRQPFPHEIQTNAPYILPAAAIFRALGVGITQAEIVNMAYFLALMFLAGLLARRMGGAYVGLCGMALMLATPRLLKFGFEGYGEIPALTWFLAAVVMYFDTGERRPTLWRSAISGLFLALAFLTKTVMLLCVSGFVICIFIQVLFHRRASIRRAVYSLLAMLTAALIPIIAFEKWKEVSLGGRDAWHNWWHYEGHAISFQAGVQQNLPGALGTLGNKIWLHLDILAHACELPLWMTATWAILVVATTFVVLLLATRDERFLAIATILCAAGLYFVWWLAITPDAKAWLRRVLDGIVCANLGFAMLVGYLIKTRERRPVSRLVAAVVLSTVPAILLVSATAGIFTTMPPDNSKLLQVVQEVKQLPDDAYLFGIGWDSSPLISLLSGRHFDDFNDVPNSELDGHRPMYLIRSRGLPSSKYINETFSLYGLKVGPLADGESSDSLREEGDFQITVAGTSVYRLPELRPRAVSLDKGPVRSQIHYEDAYPYLLGPYPPEPGNGRWLRTDNVIVLQPTPSGIFFLNGYAVPQKHFKYAHPVEVTISFNGCPTPARTIPTGTDFTVEIHALQYCKLDMHEPWSVRIQVNNVVDSALTTDERELSLLSKSMGFIAEKQAKP